MRLPPLPTFIACLCLTFAVAAAGLNDRLLRSVEAQILDQVEQQVSDSVEQAVTDSVEQAVTDSVEQSVTDAVEQSVTDSVEQAVTDAVEQTVTDSVEQSVTDAVEHSVTDSVEQAVTDAVEQTVTDSVEQSVTDAVEQTVTDSVELAVTDAVERAITDTVEQTVTDTVELQVTDAVERALTDGIEGRITDGVERSVEAAVDDLLEPIVARKGDDVVAAVKAALSGLPSEPLDHLLNVADTGIQQTVGGLPALSQAAAALALEDVAPPPDEPFFETLDDDGWAVERDTWVILVPTASAAEIERWALRIRERRALPGLDAVLLRVDAPGDRSLAAFARAAAMSAPGTRVGRNHVYRLESRSTAEASASEQARRRPDGRAPLRLGIIDSAVYDGHPALASAAIVERDFVSYRGPRPKDHGTAIASLLVGDEGDLPGLLAPGGSLHAAAVFFEDEFGVVRATSAGLIRALDWMRQEGVDVVNMSLTGPPNELLERALETAVAAGMLVVAAVGNNGPAGQPLYPAAYPTVIGVTAVDGDHIVYRFANRGPQVAFSAFGVGVRVAVADGGYRSEDGTSLAAPVVAARLAHLEGASPAAIIEALKALAIDLDPPGFNEIYGFGLVAQER